MSSTSTESVVEKAALAWLEDLGYAVLHDPEIAAGELETEQSDLNYRDVVLEGRLHQVLVRLNSSLSIEALDDLYQVTFAALRDTLLPKLISGELWVKDAEHSVAAHV